MSSGLEKNTSLKSVKSTTNSGSSFHQKFLNRRMNKLKKSKDQLSSTRVFSNDEDDTKRTLINDTVFEQSKIESQRAPFTTLDFRKTIN
jgi:hypothetical protein